MSELDAAIRAKRDEFVSDHLLIGEYGSSTGPGHREMRAAIEAVLDLHGPVSNEAWSPSAPSIVCSCSPGGDDYYDKPYPGPEIRAIAEKLGVEVDGG